MVGLNSTVDPSLCRHLKQKFTGFSIRANGVPGMIGVSTARNHRMVKLILRASPERTWAMVPRTSHLIGRAAIADRGKTAELA